VGRAGLMESNVLEEGLGSHTLGYIFLGGL
jgi:hypothetical protein